MIFLLMANFMNIRHVLQSLTQPFRGFESPSLRQFDFIGFLEKVGVSNNT